MGVALPDLDGGVGRRRPVLARETDAKLECCAVAILDDVPPLRLGVAVVRAFVLLGPRPACGAARQHRRQGGVDRIGALTASRTPGTPRTP